MDGSSVSWTVRNLRAQRLAALKAQFRRWIVDPALRVVRGPDRSFAVWITRFRIFFMPDSRHAELTICLKNTHGPLIVCFATG